MDVILLERVEKLGQIGDVVAELERQTQINEDVLRYMTVKVDEQEAGPSVMMRKGERDRKPRRDDEQEY